jgi:putative ABC transport system ATP-binding protein/lipoprotein-releasing system ATP-binding protein
MSQSIIVCRNVVKNFTKPFVPVLKDLSFEIEKGEFTAITGHSGSGKSSLLYVLSGLDNLSSGEILLSGENMFTMDSKSLHAFRNKTIGFVFQFHYLLPELSCYENILMPARKLKKELQKKNEALDLLEEFGIMECKNKYPSQISGGQQQRVAIARSLIMGPEIVFADEPTGNLDSINGDKVMEIFNRINQEKKTTIVMVTHEKEYAERANRKIHLVDGKIVEDIKKKDKKNK